MPNRNRRRSTVTVTVLQCPYHEQSRSLEIAVDDAELGVSEGDELTVTVRRVGG